jgi:hypothetical protein
MIENYLLSTAWLLPLSSNPITAIIVAGVVIGYVVYSTVRISNTSQPFGSGTLIDEIESKKSASSAYYGFVEGGKYGNTAQGGQTGTQEEIQEEIEADIGNGDGVGSEDGIFTGSPTWGLSGLAGNLADTSGASSWATDTDGHYYPNINSVALLIETEKPRLKAHNSVYPEPIDNPNPHPVDPDLNLNDIEAINQFNKTELNLPDVDIDRDKWISVDLPLPLRNIGESFRQPLVRGTQELYSAPTTGDEISIFDPTEINNVLNIDGTSDKYFENLTRTFLGHTEASEKEIKLSEQAIVFIPTAFISGLQIDPIIGLKALYRIAEAFKSYSLGAMSAPQYNIPEYVNINTIDGINEGKNPAPVNQGIEELIKPFPSQYQEKMVNNYLIPSGTKLDVQLLMNFLGNTELYAGGEDEYKKLSNEYKNNPDAFYNSPFIQQSPSINDILNNELPENGLTLKVNRSATQVESQFDLLQKMVATNYVKTGLDQFPAPVPNLQDPDFTVDSEGKRIYQEPKPDLIIPSLAGGLGYSVASLHKSIGRYPLEIETDSEELMPNPQNPDELIPKKDHKYLPNLAIATGAMLTLGMVSANLGKNNFDLNMRNAKQIQATKAIASKGMNCACSTLDATGMNKNPTSSCQMEDFNFMDAKGVGDFFKGKQVCHTVDQNVDRTTLKEMLQNILFGVNLMKGAFFKGQNELDGEIEKAKEIKKNIDKLDDKLDDFIKDFNDGKNDLAKNFPSKSKIIKKPTQSN